MARYPKNSSPKLTDKLISEIYAAIKHGAFIETAAALVGVSKSTLYRWLRDAKSEDANPRCVKLSDAIRLAIAEDEVRHLGVINQAAFGIPKSYKLDDNGEPILDELGYPVVSSYLVKPDWKASAYRLSRRSPEKWGDKSDGSSFDSISEEEENDEIVIHFVDTKDNDPQ